MPATMSSCSRRPVYYTRFRFPRGQAHGLENEYGVNDEFMVVELLEGSLAGARPRSLCARVCGSVTCSF